jgi:hypothetical protein
MVENYDAELYLVRVDTPVTDYGITSDRVLVVHHPPDWSDGQDWVMLHTAAMMLHPSADTDAHCFMAAQTVGSHRVHVQTTLEPRPPGDGS